MNIIKNIYNIAKREVFRIIKDSNLLMVFLVAPLAYPAIYGSIYINKNEEKVPIAVCDFDNSKDSRALLREINALQNIDIIYSAGSEEEMNNLLYSSKIHASLIVPKDFSEKLKRGETSWLRLKINPGRLVVLGDIGIPISQAVNQYGAEISREYLQSLGSPALNNYAFFSPITFNFNTLYNPYLSYGEMMLPALMAIILSQLVFVGSAAAQAKEYNIGWQDLFANKKRIFSNYSIGVGKILAISAIFTIFSILIRIILVPLFNARLATDNISLLAIAILSIIASSAFGLFIGTFFKHKITTFVSLGFTSYPFFMSAGYAWPGEQLPMFIKAVSNFLPSTHFLQALYKSSQMELPINYCYNNLISLTLLTLFYLTLFQIRLVFLKKKISKEIQAV